MLSIDDRLNQIIRELIGNGITLEQAVEALRGRLGPMVKIELEVDTLDQLEIALRLGGHDEEAWTLAEEVQKADPYDVVAYNLTTLHEAIAHFQQALSLRYAELVYYGLWFAPLREALDGFFNLAQQRVTGAVGLKLWKGTLNVTKRVSPFSLYRADLASFTMGRYNPKDAEGFINLFALPVTVRPKAKAETNS